MNIYPCQRCGWLAPDCTCRAATNRRVIADVHQRHREARERAWRSGWAASLAVARHQQAA
ncbi:hypothetical protein ACFQE5_22225 [Pseudonocardia hispaniensis]|uniref:Uncharacterized protein n=1 Tax=Pseudonocardia hispaniensis TaxID=904933 RepID=A0ABW1J842_9PSEU